MELSKNSNGLETNIDGSLITVDSILQQALNEIYSTYGALVSIQNKQKSLLKFGKRVTSGATWETLMTLVGSEVEETFATDNVIDTVASTQASDNGKTLNLEYHTISDGKLTFGVQQVTLDASDGTTPVPLTTPCARVSRMYNTSVAPITGSIYVYEDNSGRDDNKTHLVIPAGSQQTEKAATSISDEDYWIVTNISISVLAKVTKYAEARLETRPVGGGYWRPATQTFAATDSGGTVQLLKNPYIIVPANCDVRLAVKTNTGSVEVAGGFNGILASVVS